MSTNNVLTVSILNRYIKSVLDGDSNLQSIYVKGQISNFKQNYSSGHYYFTLKDENAQVSAVMFRNANMKLRFLPENDMSVIVRCRVSLYEVSGTYQLYVDDMQPDGTGALALAFEQLKKKLFSMGYFDESHKKPIPRYPDRIGVVTSENGAAFRDIVNIISRRFPYSEIVLCPVSVQGSAAASQIADAIYLFNKRKCADVLIVGRGGGSVEDLWAFNEEPVAKAVYESDIPVISAVGHETDFTICDFVADLRAPTPSAAAELSVPDCEEMMSDFNTYGMRFRNAVIGKYNAENNRLSSNNALLKKLSPQSYIDNIGITVDRLSEKLNNTSLNNLKDKEYKLGMLISSLDASSPLKILDKGYSVVTKDGVSVTDSQTLNKGDIVNIRFKNGDAECEVI